MFREEIMVSKRFQPEQIIGKLRESKILLANAGFGAMSPYYSLFKIVPNFLTKHKFFIKKDFP